MEQTPMDPKLFSNSTFERVFWVVMDGVGAGESPDAHAYSDQGADTLANCAHAFRQQTGRGLRVPHLDALGLSKLYPNLDREKTHTHLQPNVLSHAWYGRAQELSAGKDTTSGHWEMAGYIVKKAFKTYPDGFPEEVVNAWAVQNKLPGALGNKPASGTEILDELGREHIDSGKPILYTSADSVWQVAAHETYFGLERLYKICESARELCDALGVARVIARPFIGEGTPESPFKRTYNRKDYARPPEQKTVLNFLQENKIKTTGVGKIASIFGNTGIDESLETKGNRDGMKRLLELAKSTQTKGLIYANLIDFDMLFGHRRDAIGFGHELETFDNELGQLTAQLKPNDLLILTADHGNDPTYRGTDHTREYVPVLAWSPRFQVGERDLGILGSFGSMGATIAQSFLGQKPKELSSFQSFLEN